MSEEKPTDSEPDKTVIRQTPNDDKTNVMGIDDGDGGKKASAAIRSGPASGAKATILREPAKDGKGDATIIRAPQPNLDKTVMRRRDADKTVMREEDTDAASAGSDDATVMREGDNDATVMRDAGDDDATIIGNHGGGDDDATVIGNDAPRNSDTTYIASVGKQIESKGNSEAGRLLKNRFVLEEKMGSGGMGDVYKALDLRAQEAQEKNPYIAIKLLNENFSRHKDAFVSLQREASKTRGIPHPNIMGVYDFDREGDTVFMSMELLTGKPLDDYLKEHPEGVSVEDAWNIIDGICQGLSRAHGAGIVHSDFKPGNIFYTAEKVAKVFDFGIARAVKSPGDIVADGEKTVFDAGSLGALTPTYASYEMLKGMEPSKSDDVYAVALVAYELFTGRHPYDRTPADKAYDRGMKPEPIPFLKRRQWKALKKGLELRGEERTQTVDEFQEAMFSEDPPIFRYAAIAAVLIGSVGFGAYNFLFGGGEQTPAELTKLRADLGASLALVQDQLNTPAWGTDLWHEQLFTGMNRLVGYTIDLEDTWREFVPEQELSEAKGRVEDQKANVFKAYLEKVQNEINAAAQLPQDDWEQVKQALQVLATAEEIHEHAKNKKYFAYGDQGRVNSLNTSLEVAIQLRQLRNTQFEEAEAAQIAAAEARAKAEAEAAEAARIEQERMDAYDTYIGDLTDILRCKGNIPSKFGDPNYREPDAKLRVAGDELALLGTTLNNLRRTYPERWDYDYENIAKAVAGCIATRIGRAKPERAKEVQEVVKTYLPDEPLIANIKINDRDPCGARNLEGRGGSSRRFCVDQLGAGIEGPEMVVIPPLEESLGKFAISKTEIKIGDYNQYCEVEGCEPLSGSSSLPATNLTLAQAEAYTAWLSDQSGRVYRLPKVQEWRHAAATNQPVAGVDPNVNCTVDSRGVTRGDKMATAESGRSNDWGLFHYVGNAREWALDEEGNVYALGGARIDPIANCSVNTSVAHTGDADPVTGFRILRQISSS